MPDDPLAEYRSKRDASATPEPEGSVSRSDDRRFVIHHHDASSDHYDLRLEAEGVLKCWAVPKGPSTDPSQRRLAVRTEDHPVDYLDFEGVIPEGEYGAGTMMVWDAGTYVNLTTDDGGDEIPVDRAIDDGHFVFELHGRKVAGGYALIQTGSDWLLVKEDDAHSDARRRPTSTQTDSVKTGRSMAEIAGEGGS